MYFLGWQGIYTFVGLSIAIVLILVAFAKAVK